VLILWLNKIFPVSFAANITRTQEHSQKETYQHHTIYIYQGHTLEQPDGMDTLSLSIVSYIYILEICFDLKKKEEENIQIW